MTYFICCTL